MVACPGVACLGSPGTVAGATGTATQMSLRHMLGDEMQMHRVADLGAAIDDVVRVLVADVEASLPGAEVHHVGATAVGGWTKGDVDVCIRVSPDGFEPARAALLARYEIAQPANWTSTFASFSAPGLPLPAGVQLVVRNSENDVMVRLTDRLRVDPALARARGDYGFLACYPVLSLEPGGERASADPGAPA